MIARLKNTADNNRPAYRWGVSAAAVLMGMTLAASANAQSLDGFDEPFPALDDSSLDQLPDPFVDQDPFADQGGFVEPIAAAPGSGGIPQDSMLAGAAAFHSGGSGGAGNMMARRGPSAADQQAFAEVYDLLAQQYVQATQTGMLFNNADAIIQQQPQPFPQQLPNPGPVDPLLASDPALDPLLNSLGVNDQLPPELSGGLGNDLLGGGEDLANLPEPDFLDEAPEESGGILNNFYLGGYVGGTLPQGTTATNEAASNTADLAGKFSYGGGGLVGIRFGDFRLEAEGQYAKSEYDVTNGTGIFNGQTTLSSTRLAGFGNALYGLNLFGNFGVLAGGSVGYAQQTDTLDATDYTARGFLYGPLVGLTYQIGDKFELAAKYRYLLGNDFEFKAADESVAYTRGVSEHQGMLAARFRF